MNNKVRHQEQQVASDGDVPCTEREVQRYCHGEHSLGLALTRLSDLSQCDLCCTSSACEFCFTRLVARFPAVFLSIGIVARVCRIIQFLLACVLHALVLAH